MNHPSDFNESNTPKDQENFDPGNPTRDLDDNVTMAQYINFCVEPVTDYHVPGKPLIYLIPNRRHGPETAHRRLPTIKKLKAKTGVSLISTEGWSGDVNYDRIQEKLTINRLTLD